MDIPIHTISHRFGCLSLDGRHVQVKECQSSNSFNLLHDALRIFDSKYDQKIQSRSQLKCIPKIKELLKIPERIQETEYSFET